MSLPWTRRSFALSMLPAVAIDASAWAAPADKKPEPPDHEPQKRPVSGSESPGMESYDRLIEPFMRKWRMPGGAVAVVKQGRLVLARGYGWADVDAQEPVLPRSTFRLASVSKPFTAVTILRLIQDGKLRMDDKVLDVLSKFKLPPKGDQRWHDITLRHLLHQTGGWDRGKAFDPMFRSVKIAEATNTPAPATSEAIIRYMLGEPLESDPGKHYAYSNFGYCLLGRVIEAKTGMGYADAVQELVLKPAGITRMRIGHTRLRGRGRDEVRYYNRPAKDLATSVFPNEHEKVPVPYGGFYLEAMDSHGGWIGSAVDLLRFVTALEGSRGPQLIDGDALARMVVRPDPPVSVGSETYYGLGWSIRPVAGGANWWHNGSLPGTSTLLVRAEEGMSWAVLFNARPASDEKGNFGGDLDRLLRQCAREVRQWPSHNLFDTLK